MLLLVLLVLLVVWLILLLLLLVLVCMLLLLVLLLLLRWVVRVGRGRVPWTLLPRALLPRQRAAAAGRCHIPRWRLLVVWGREGASVGYVGERPAVFR